MYFMGIDTSCYTSSIAIIDSNENLIYDGRILLEVEIGSKGLRQSDAIFQHSKNLPKLCHEAMKLIQPAQLKSIGVSSRPRDIEGSYMPVFTAGHNLAKVASSLLRIPIIECSHQQGHILSGAWSIQKQYTESLLVYHISGGTTELLKVGLAKEAIEIVGGTEDLNAGQYIDRVGVVLGFKFPCGKEMDKLSSCCNKDYIELPLSVKDTYLSFSGPESHVQRLIKNEAHQENIFAAQIAKSVFLNISKSLERTIINASRKFDIKNVLIVGGVASNTIISNHLQTSQNIKSMGIHVDISKPQYSSDNAIGAAIYARRAYYEFGGLNEHS